MPKLIPQIALPVPLPILRPTSRFRRRKLLALTSLGLAGLVAGLLSGCSSLSQAATSLSPTGANYSALTGNWRFTSDVAVPVDLAGALAVEGTQVSGRLHTTAGPCAAAKEASFAVSGTIDGADRLLLSGQDDANHMFQIAGLLAPDRHSLVDPAVTVVGSCTGERTLQGHGLGGSTGQQYQSVTGSYQGSFTDSQGDALAVDASLSQPTTPDANGVYHLTGTATFASVPCLGSTVITSSTVTGNQISATYTDSNTGATVVGNGTFSADAQTLTITSWTLSGGCGSDAGSGILTHL